MNFVFREHVERYLTLLRVTNVERITSTHEAPPLSPDLVSIGLVKSFVHSIVLKIGRCKLDDLVALGCGLDIQDGGDELWSLVPLIPVLHIHTAGASGVLRPPSNRIESRLRQICDRAPHRRSLPN